MIVAVVGPTGVGKTRLSIELAKNYKAIIVGCDAVQIYQELDIGSAKVTEEEKENITHYLIDIKKPSEEYTVRDYQKDLRNILDNNKDKNIIIVGGTGLYLTAGICDYNFEKATNEKNKLLYDVKIVGLTAPRDVIYDRINQRVDAMLKNGLVAEVKNLYRKYPDSKVLKRAIGYKEIIAYLKGEISLEEATEDIKKNSRHYAKRQYTWFNHQNVVKWFNVNFQNFDLTIKEVINYLEGEKNEEG